MPPPHPRSTEVISDKRCLKQAHARSTTGTLVSSSQKVRVHILRRDRTYQDRNLEGNRNGQNKTLHSVIRIDIRVTSRTASNQKAALLPLLSGACSFIASVGLSLWCCVLRKEVVKCVSLKARAAGTEAHSVQSCQKMGDDDDSVFMFLFQSGRWLAHYTKLSNGRAEPSCPLFATAAQGSPIF